MVFNNTILEGKYRILWAIPWKRSRSPSFLDFPFVFNLLLALAKIACSFYSTGCYETVGVSSPLLSH